MSGSTDKDVEIREGSNYHPGPESQTRGSELEIPGLQGVCARGQRHQAGRKKCSWYMQGNRTQSRMGVTRAGDPGKRCCLPKASCCVSIERCWLRPTVVGRKDGCQEKKRSGEDRICELKVRYIRCFMEGNRGKIPRVGGKIPLSL